MTTLELQNDIQIKVAMLSQESLEKVKTVVDSVIKEQTEKKKNYLEERPIGSLKGVLLYMSPDFDEPLEDFKDYM